MARHFSELESISKAIHSSYELLKSEQLYSENAEESLKEAEESLNSAILYLLQQTKKQGI